jgi:hypothetical protein
MLTTTGHHSAFLENLLGYTTINRKLAGNPTLGPCIV